MIGGNKGNYVRGEA